MADRERERALDSMGSPNNDEEWDILVARVYSNLFLWQELCVRAKHIADLILFFIIVLLLLFDKVLVKQNNRPFLLILTFSLVFIIIKLRKRDY